MLSTPHVVLGAAIAVKIPNPVISIPLAFASHFLLEVVPHWNPHLNSEIKKYGKLTKNTVILIAIDAFVSLLLGFYIARTQSLDTYHFWTIIAACLAAVLPDLVEAPYFFMGVKNKFLNMWIKLQKVIQVDANFFWGIFNQSVVLMATLYWIFQA